MKKIFLFFMFLCMVSFSEFEFGDLKWGSSKEEVKDYLVKTFDVKRSFIWDMEDGTLKVSLEPVKFADISLKEVEFEFNLDGEFHSWIGETYERYEKYDNVKEYLEKKYELNEKKIEGSGTDALSKFIKDNGDFLILFKEKK